MLAHKNGFNGNNAGLFQLNMNLVHGNLCARFFPNTDRVTNKMLQDFAVPSVVPVSEMLH